MGMGIVHVRAVDPQNTREIELVAARMRDTLIEVLGDERGAAMYSMEWLVERVRFHLDPAQSTGQVLVAEDAGGEIWGHTIVRLDKNDAGQAIGLFSTVYVMPEKRRQSVAQTLLNAGEEWFSKHRVAELHTYTDVDNTKLIRLFESQGFKCVEERNGFAILVKQVAPRTPQ